MEVVLPEHRRQAIMRYYPDTGKAWVEAFGDLLASCATRWHLKYVGTAEEGWPTNLIVYAEQRGGGQVVLKVGHPHLENRTAMTALQAYDGHGAVRMIDVDLDTQSVLMERITPGTCFREAIKGRARSGTELPLFADLPIPGWRGGDLPTFQGWLDKAFAEYRARSNTSEQFIEYLGMAEDLYAHLLARYPSDCLLHGDLHHENILLDQRRGWLAIDPKGVMGPHVMECGRFIHNFIEDEIGVERVVDGSKSQILEILDIRFGTFERMLPFPRRDIIAATFIDLVVANCWTLNDGDDASNGLALIGAAAERLG